jgi:hypothetical protein
LRSKRWATWASSSSGASNTTTLLEADCPVP